MRFDLRESVFTTQFGSLLSSKRSIAKSWRLFEDDDLGHGYRPQGARGLSDEAKMLPSIQKRDLSKARLTSG